MRVTLELNPEEEAAIQARARELGLSVDALLQDVVSREASRAVPASRTGRERASAFLAWADKFPASPQLSDDAVSRDSQYPDRF